MVAAGSAACAHAGPRVDATSTAPAESSSVLTPSVLESRKPALSAALARGSDRATAYSGSESVGLEVGATAVEFVLKDIQGNEHSLSGLLAEKPVLMVLGSFTCPVFRGSCASTDDLYGKYGDRVHFITVYTLEAQPVGSKSPYSDEERLGVYSIDPQGSPIPQPMTYEERLQLARKTVAEAGISVPVLVDEMDNPVWCTYGQAPNIGYLIGTDGRIVARQRWYDPGQMESAILELVKDI